MKEKIERFSVGKILISRVNLNSVISYLDECIKSKKNGYICVTNTRTSHFSNKNLDYCKIQNNSLLTIPDGVPLVWLAHNMGYNEVGRSSGPDLIKKILSQSLVKKYSHYFFGSTPKTIKIIKEKFESEYEGVELKGAVSPPFQPIEEFNIDELAKEINQLKPTFFWCGLGAPKQEKLMALLQPKLETTICIGVGLAFEYLSGTVKRPPRFFQKLGLEWLFRSAQQPLRFCNRMIKPLFWMLSLLIKSFLKRKS